MNKISNIFKYVVFAVIAMPVFTLNAQTASTTEPAPEPISATCSVVYSAANTGGVDIEWSVSDLSGGDGNYSYTWSGDASGSSESYSGNFSTPGSYDASVAITDLSGNFLQVSCDSVDIEALSFNSCEAVETNSNTGYEVEWKADISGGLAPYTFSWEGTDGLTGSDRTTSITYTTPGEKTAKVLTVTSSDGQDIDGSDCSPTVTLVEAPTELEVSCSVSESEIEVGNTVTWSSNVAGGLAPYYLTWSGEVTGSDESYEVTYDTVGEYSSALMAADSSGSFVNATCGLTVSEKEEEQRSSGGGSSRRRSSSNDDDNTATTTVETSTTTVEATTTPVVTTPVVTATPVVTTGSVLGTTDTTESTTTATTSDDVSTTTDEVEEGSNLLAALGALDFAANWFWLLILILILLGLLIWFILKRKNNKENN